MTGKKGCSRLRHLIVFPVRNAVISGFLIEQSSCLFNNKDVIPAPCFHRGRLCVAESRNPEEFLRILDSRLRGKD